MNRHPQRPLPARLSLLACALAALAAQAQAQNAAQEATAEKPPQTLQRVEIVGSSIKRITAEGPSAIAVYKRADIEATGATSTVELLSKMAAVTAFDDGSNGNSFSAGATSASLRNMGAQNVLVLLNGRRLANYAFAAGTDTPFVDLNTIPLAAVERVEILRDGASALYGSDAVAGVMNFVTKTDYQGMELAGKLGQRTAGDQRRGEFSLTAGRGDIDRDGYNLLAMVAASRREPVLAGKHSLTRSTDLRPYGGLDLRDTARSPGSIQRIDQGYRKAHPACPAGQVEVDNIGDEYCRTDIAADAQLSPTLERINASLMGSKSLGANMSLFGELVLGHNKTDWRGGYPTLESGVDHRVTPGMAAYVPALGRWVDDKGVVHENSPLQAYRSVDEAGERGTRSLVTSSRALAGLRGTQGNWDWEAAAMFSRSRGDQTEFNMLKRDAVLNALAKGGYNPFVPVNSRADAQALLTDITKQATSTLNALDAKVSNPELTRLLGGPLGMAAGVQFMHESMKEVADPQLAAKNIENWSGTSSDGSRKVASGFVEFNLQPNKATEIQLALRSDHYSDFGTTTNPKIAVAFRPNSDWLLRAGFNTAFKAPSLPQMHMGSTNAYPGEGIRDWIRCKPMGLNYNQCAYYPRLTYVPNEQLKPERSDIWSAGLAFNPSKALNTTVDLYYLKQKDSINLLDGQYLIDHEFDIPGYADLVTRDPRNPVLEQRYPGLKNGRLKYLTLPYMNVGGVETGGVDWTLRLEHQWAGIRFWLENEYNAILRYKSAFTPDGDLLDRVGGYSQEKWRNTLRVGGERGAWRVQLNGLTYAGVLNVSSPAVLQPGVDPGRMPSRTVWDLSVGYTGWKDLKLNLTVLNVFDIKPRFSTGYGGFYDDRYGPTIQLAARYTLR
ncbi:TonB-dependent receptor [Mitsuaria sp. WAJ17]|uniref:TonB-dependent receptor plug domain-containing protein n=1 Tax=Mitsuaria sp. WAJ17 TaxID=2761452 RepID=UPI001601C60C|nr:TonB-dependent receptor [Mitsuaria sp. WAJ17]MBB2486139.1 TonB-dependent receptor [Mitsuaria sp. WAJ17]